MPDERRERAELADWLRERIREDWLDDPPGDHLYEFMQRYDAIVSESLERREQPRWRKVHWGVTEEYPWGVIEIIGHERDSAARPVNFGPMTDERIVAHCFHEADADAIIDEHDRLAEASDA
jgi:hypothetical protein